MHRARKINMRMKVAEIKAKTMIWFLNNTHIIPYFDKIQN
jgi:hypothetical protein